MTPSQFLSGHSLEITARDVDPLREVCGTLPPATQVSITFLPGDSVETLAAVAGQVRELGFRPVPHISARRLCSAEQLEAFLDLLREADAIEHVFVIAGDLPTPLGPYADALDVIRSGMLERFGVRQLGVAGYPEGHPAIDRAQLHQAMIGKLAAIAAAGQRAEIVTQFAFDADPVLGWIERLRDAGIDAPIRIGLAGPASVKALMRFAMRCGVGASAKALSKYGISLGRLLSTATPDLMMRELASRIERPRHGPVGAHLYPFGGIARCVDWAAEATRSGEGAFAVERTEERSAT